MGPWAAYTLSQDAQTLAAPMIKTTDVNQFFSEGPCDASWEMNECQKMTMRLLRLRKWLMWASNNFLICKKNAKLEQLALNIGLKWFGLNFIMHRQHLLHLFHNEKKNNPFDLFCFIFNLTNVMSFMEFYIKWVIVSIWKYVAWNDIGIRHTK